MTTSDLETKRAVIREFVDKHCDNKIFSVSFIKKTTGEVREMVCRQGVFKYSGGGVSTTAHCPDLMGTYDMSIASKLPEEDRNKAYRTINLDGLLGIKCGEHELSFS